MATLLEEGVCVIKDEKTAKWVLEELTKPSKEPFISENVRVRTRKALKEGIEWAEKMQL
ncbi:hypothetical protein [Methanotorris igneus]|uniref:Uncharacterized protein n=1 Tax=Methanotorris igneus (strain DSM 5666 / JCM 11834 / Kol 5) TaxID=880724 RepID=F6BB49_METIK|nr:hypothetical protein [Methanotorris igneus]AEF95934.1 hypothetical protein Metig_0378 [Methanotorris igneus Kol 5]